MLSPDVRTSREDELIAAPLAADSCTTDEPAFDTPLDSPSPEDVILLMVDDSGKPPGYSGSPVVPLEPSPEEACPPAVTSQG